MHRKVRYIIMGIQLGVVVLVGLFLALGINAILSSVLVDLTPMGVAAQDEKEENANPQQQPQPAEPNALVYNRNLFNSWVDDGSAPSGDSEDVADVEEEPAPPAPVAPGVPVETDLKILLVGTQVAEDPEWSLAVVQDLEEGQDSDAEYKRVGQSFMDGDATIVHIERKRVYFERHSRNDRLEYMDIESTAADVMARARQAEQSRPAQPANPRKNNPNTGGAQARGGQAKANGGGARKVASAGAVDPSRIEAMGGDKYGVPRDMAEAVRANPKMLNDPKFGPPPQIQPVYKGGGVQGFRVLGVQSSSIYGKLGIRNGDIILQVNDKIVDNPQKALAFFDQLAPNEDVGVKINRRGRHRTLTYTLN